MRERLSFTLTLNVGGVEHTIPGGNVRGFSLHMESYGVSGSVEFVLQDDKTWGGKYEDKLLADFQKPDLGTVTISVMPGHLETKTEASDAKITTTGIILEKWVSEETTIRVIDEQAVVFRRYRVTFEDFALALWKQHFRVALYTKKSFKDVVEDQKGDKISLTYDWDVITTVVPLVFFHQDPASRSSFYDLVMWYCRERLGVFTYDHAAGTYKITKVKDSSGTAKELMFEDLASMASYFPPVPRHKPRVLNSYTESPRTEVCDNANAATGIFRDALMRTPIAADVDARVTLEKARPLLPLREVTLTFRRFPTIAMSPGSLVNISDKGGFSTEIITSTEAFRVFSIDLSGKALDEGPEKTYGDTATSFEVDVSAKLEQKSDTALRLPAIVEPRFPGHLEGKVLSEIEDAAKITYEFKTDADTSVDTYRIVIPLFDSQEIAAPYEPESGAGNYYLPLYKNQRVVVAFDFSKAWVVRLVDWRAEARVPLDGQGQHMFFGKSATSNTSVLHDYQSEKPVMRMLRTNDKDTILLKLEEGKMTLKVEEQKG